MPTLLSARSRSTRGAAAAAAGGGGGQDGGGAGNGACYGIAACAVALVLFCALAASVSVRMAFTFGGLALVAFGVVGCLAPASWCAGPPRDDGGAIAGSEAAAAADAAAGVVAAARARRRFGMPKAAIDALPTFAYTTVNGAECGGDLESGAAAADVEQCSVCLEDVEAGEMVRQLPACKHLFHVECIDMWLHSHRTCPVCRCNLLRSQRKVAAVKTAAAAAAAEEERPAEDVLPPV